VLTRRAFLGLTGAAALLPSPRIRAARYDLVIKGGRVIDPSNRVDRVADVAIEGGRIRAVQPNIAAADAGELVDARGKIVTPGLVDLHVHVGAALTPATLMRDGVTSMVDGGSAGADNIDALVGLARAAPNRVRIFLNIARTGLATPNELLNIDAADVDLARRAMAQHRDWIVGVKVRLSASVAGDHDLEALRRARQAAGPLPVMLHVGQTLPLPKILDPAQSRRHRHPTSARRRRTACSTNGACAPAVGAARRRGVRFDVGNGRTAHITWATAETATRDGFWPDTISSDITGPGRTFRVFDLPTVISKFLMLGMPLDQAIGCVTAQAAANVSAFKGLGTLGPDRQADVAVLELRDGDFDFVDNVDATRTGHRKLVTTAVVMNGKVAAVSAYRPAVASGHRAISRARRNSAISRRPPKSAQSSGVPS
jgi:dihydroorotase